MRTIARGAWTALALSAASLLAPAGAQQSPDRNCRDDHGVDRCDPARLAQFEKDFGVRPIEALQAPGIEVRRAFIVDGYGRDVAVLSFLRERNGPPLLRVFLPPVDGRPRVLEAKVSEAAFRSATAAPIEPPPPRDVARNAEAGTVRICFHGWMATVESLSGGRSVRRTGHACADSLPFKAAFEMADLAVKALPACAALDPEGYRNSVMQLVGCGQLEGDRKTAAAARNWLDAGRLLTPSPATLPKEIAPLLAEDAVLRWAGEREVVGREAVAASWLYNLTKDPEPDFWATRYRGASAEEAVVEGRFRYWEGDKTPIAHEAAAKLTLRRAGADFRLRRIEVGAFEKVRG